MELRHLTVSPLMLASVLCLGLLTAMPVVAASGVASVGANSAGRYIVTLRGLVPAAMSGRSASSSSQSPAATATARNAEVARVDRVDRSVATVAARYGIQAGTRYHYALQGFAASLTSAQVAALRADPSVQALTPVQPVYPAGGEIVPPGVTRVGADPVTNRAPPNLSAVSVAVLDTGIRYIPDDPELNVAARGIDCATDALTGRSGHKAWADVDSSEGHGTHVSGTIAAKNTGTGIVGVAPGVKLFAVRIFASQGGSVVGDTETVACGVDWVASTRVAGQEPVGSRPIDVANMSIQGPRDGGDGPACPSPAGSGDAEHAAICSASELGITFVVAAGNSARDSAGTVPAAYDSVITVAAMSDYDGVPGAQAGTGNCGERDDSFATYSNFGAAVDLIAPGSCVTSLGRTAGSTHQMSGTSMATPHVSGAAARYVAILLAHHAGVRNPDVINVDVVRKALRAAASFDWTTASDPDGVPDRLLDLVALQATSPALKVWAFPAQVASKAPVGGDDAHGNPVVSTFSVQLQRVALFPGAVAIRVDSPPAGVTVTLANSTLSGLGEAGISTTLQLSVDDTAADGSYTLTLHATSAGLTDATPITLRIDRHKPTIQAFSAAMLDAVQLGVAEPVRLTWSGSDVGSGIVRYEIQRQLPPSTTWMPFSLSPATATSVVRLVAPRAPYSFRVRAVDAAGNISDWAVLNVKIRVRDSIKPLIQYSHSNSWRTKNKSTAYGGSFARSTTPGAFAGTSFSGRGIAWVAPVGPGKGTAKVYLDTVLVGTIGQSAATLKPRQVIWASGALAPGPHTLRIEVVSGIIDVDAILILN